jgi:hypothetical protein
VSGRRQCRHKFPNGEVYGAESLKCSVPRNWFGVVGRFHGQAVLRRRVLACLPAVAHRAKEGTSAEVILIDPFTIDYLRPLRLFSMFN